MKRILIVYGSTYGYTKECVMALQNQLEGQVDLLNVMDHKDVSNVNAPVLDSYDAVVIGASVYMGQIQKKVKAYCEQHKEVLARKKVALFLACGSEEHFNSQLESNFSSEFLQSLIAKVYVGGVLRKERMNFAHKLITNVIISSAEKEGKAPMVPHKENLESLAALLNQL